MKKMDDGRRKLIREMYVACGHNASLAARKLGYSSAIGSYWHRIKLFDDIPLLEKIDPPLTHCLVDFRLSAPVIVERFSSLYEAIFSRNQNSLHYRVYRCMGANGIQELSRKEAEIERRAWMAMITEEGLRRRQEFEAAEQAKRDRQREEILLRQNEVLERATQNARRR